jgi:membrane protein implicated in regulation of membrane protease activity
MRRASSAIGINAHIGYTMALITAVFSTIGTWFGFVGSCVVGPDPTCRPFLAFVALTVVSAVALALVMRAYRALQPEDERLEAEQRRIAVRERQAQERVRRRIAAKVAPRAAAHRGWRMPA